MKTEELINFLANNAEPVDPRAPARRLMAAFGAGSLATLLIMLFTLGVRHDISNAMHLPMFWIKLAFPALIAWIALYAAKRLARPGMTAGYAPRALAMLVAALWIVAGVVLFSAGPGGRGHLVFGDTWLFCLIIIPLLSIPLLAAAMWALKGLAPTRPSLAGGAAGLLAGSTSAAIYALHCPELTVTFIAIWYILAMLIPAAIGALAGPRLLRW